ncbi:hypothetical protein RUM43_006089 [Polyplax serrata]|uniref:Probable deoxycytidylate deaminase n=1 Tax=Polyplax serrata TaxID=468196 RepID=A0AAN8PC41_POLSC
MSKFKFDSLRNIKVNGLVVYEILNSSVCPLTERNCKRPHLSYEECREDDSNLDVKRQNYIDWDDYFMATAFLAAKRSKDPCTQVGACIVNKDKIIVGIGYNGFPHGCSDDVFPWRKNSESPLENKYFYVCHAEVNAILNRNTSDTKGCKMYVALFPCNECAKFIIQSGIEEVIYMSNKNFSKLETIAARRMFEAAGVTYRYEGKRSKSFGVV